MAWCLMLAVRSSWYFFDVAVRGSSPFLTQPEPSKWLRWRRPILKPDGHAAVAAVSVAGPVRRLRPETHKTAIRAAAPAFGSKLVSGAV